MAASGAMAVTREDSAMRGLAALVATAVQVWQAGSA